MTTHDRELVSVREVRVDPEDTLLILPTLPQVKYSTHSTTGWISTHPTMGWVSTHSTTGWVLNPLYYGMGLYPL